MTDQESQEEARRAAEAVLRLAEKQLSPASANSTSGMTSATGTGQDGGPTHSIKNALHKAQDKVSASIETFERAAVETMESIQTGGAAAAASSPSVGDVAQETGRSVKVALHRAQGSIRAVQEKVSSSLDTAKKVDSLYSSSGETKLAATPGNATTSVTGSGDVAKEAHQPLKSALNKAQDSFRVAQGKVSASMESIEMRASQTFDSMRSATTNKGAVTLSSGTSLFNVPPVTSRPSDNDDEIATNTVNTSTPKPSQEEVDAKVSEDLSTVSEKIELCRSMLVGGVQSDPTNREDAILIVIGYLEACSPRMVGLINDGTAGALGSEVLERCLQVNDELRLTLEDYDKACISTNGRSISLNSIGSASDLASDEEISGDLEPVSAQTSLDVPLSSD
mmetsp:Transcript_13629/g.29609  ORF Transcript_13629/g.29609 Transcript_13629/m.29609 type:complete len:394 (-) Transcript_13629:103-1284(-)